MCYRPIKIKNTKLDFDSRIDKKYLSIPCGRCYQCVSKLKKDWYTRAYCEWKHYHDNGGCTMFFTLTYSPEHLPTHTFIDDSGVEKTIPCFKREDITLFMKRFRINASRNFKSIGSIRYLITCEYGDKHGRPHYHALFYFEHDIHPIFAHTLVSEAWGKGIVHNTGKVTDPMAINYTTKYITKDYAYQSTNLPNKKRPFHCSSKGFGECIITDYSLDISSVSDALRSRTIPEIDLSKGTQSDVNLPIPQYILRKMLYNLEYSERKIPTVLFTSDNGYQELDYDNCIVKRMPHFRLNSLGKSLKVEDITSSIEKIQKNFIDLYDNISKILHNESSLRDFNNYFITPYKNKIGYEQDYYYSKISVRTYSDYHQVIDFLTKERQNDFYRLAQFVNLYYGYVPVFQNLKYKDRFQSFLHGLYPEKKHWSERFTATAVHRLYSPIHNQNYYYTYYVDIFNALNYVLGVQKQRFTDDIKLIHESLKGKSGGWLANTIPSPLLCNRSINKFKNFSFIPHELQPKQSSVHTG